MIKDQTILLLHGANSVGNEWENFENEFKKLGNKVIKPTHINLLKHFLNRLNIRLITYGLL